VKILFVVEQYVKEGGRYYREFFRILQEQGVSVVLANLSESEPFREDVGRFADRYYSFGLMGDYYRAVPGLTRVIRNERPAVIQAIEMIPSFYSALAMLTVLRSRPRLVYGRRHDWAHGPRQKLMYRVALTVCSKVIAVSPAMEAVAKEEHPRAKRKIMSIPNGITLDAGRDPTEEERSVLQSLRDDSAEHVAVLLARLRRVKGHSVAMEAAARLRQRHDGLRLLFVGDGQERDAIRRELEERELGGCISLTGYIEHVREVLEVADMMIAPSLSEPLNKSVVEAFAAGVPVVASGVGGLKDLITHGETGLLVPPGDSEALADAMEELMTRPEYAARLAANARRVYEESLTPEAMVGAYLRVYRELAGEA
jgi:glycosyltransferase involved in cell wall biosynthesis